MESHNKTKVAVVTGGSRGIGAGIARVLASGGYNLAITYATQQKSAMEVASCIEKEFRRTCLVIKAEMRGEQPSRLRN